MHAVNFSKILSFQYFYPEYPKVFFLEVVSFKNFKNQKCIEH